MAGTERIGLRNLRLRGRGLPSFLMDQPYKAPPGTVNIFMILPGIGVRSRQEDSTRQNMASIERKRGREAKPQKSNKRQRVEPGCARAKQAGVEVTSLDNLAWKEVALPDRLEDAEGFFGLEEIEDVAVVRDDESGRVEYRVGKESNWSRSSQMLNNPGYHQPTYKEVRSKALQWQRHWSVKIGRENKLGS